MLSIWTSLKNCRLASSPIPTQRHLLTPLGNKPFENTVGKGEIARNGWKWVKHTTTIIYQQTSLS